MIICKNNTVFAKSDFWSKTRQPAPVSPSASNMFANGNVNSCACVLRKSIYSLMTRMHASLNPIVNSIVRGDVYCTSALRIQWVSQLYNM